jgi:hypothetical protein
MEKGDAAENKNVTNSRLAIKNPARPIITIVSDLKRLNRKSKYLVVVLRILDRIVSFLGPDISTVSGCKEFSITIVPLKIDISFISSEGCRKNTIRSNKKDSPLCTNVLIKNILRQNLSVHL